MNHFIYMMAKFFPFWAIPVAVIIVQLGIFFRRKSSSLQYYCWFGAAVLVLLAMVWLAFRGDMNSDQWLKQWE